MLWPASRREFLLEEKEEDKTHISCPIPQRETARIETPVTKVNTIRPSAGGAFEPPKKKEERTDEKKGGVEEPEIKEPESQERPTEQNDKEENGAMSSLLYIADTEKDLIKTEEGDYSSEFNGDVVEWETLTPEGHGRDEIPFIDGE